MTEKRTPVLIVGAGPTGLMAACQLARFGVDFRIIDSKSGPTRESRALVVQGRTLEIYQQLGISDRSLEEGYVASAMNMHANGVHRARVPLGEIGDTLSPFPFLLVLEQSRNEQILVDQLNAQARHVDWQTSFESLEQTEAGVDVKVTRPDGTDETIHCDWVIATDGASSPIRHALNMPFGGGTYNERFYVADLNIDGNVLHTEGSLFFSKTGFALILPLDGGKHFRLVGIVPQSIASENPTFDEIRRDLDQIFHRKLEFKEPNWFTSYTVHHRCVESFQSGRILFAGDAAHIHSPAGGQGMNTGLLDAHNLAWKLALVVTGQASRTLVETYNEERLPFAHQLLETTDRAFQAAMSQSALPVFARLYVFPTAIRFAMRFSAARRRFFETVSQIGIHHRRRSLSVDHRTGRDRLRAGDRFPPIELEVDKKDCSSFDLLAEPGFQVIDFAPPAQAQKNRQACQQVSDKFGLTMAYREAICLDPGWRQDVENRTYLVRPDMYIGLATNEMSEGQLTNYLRDTVGLSG